MAVKKGKHRLFFWLFLLNLTIMFSGLYISKVYYKTNIGEAKQVYADSNIEDYESTVGETKIFLRIMPAKETDAKPLEKQMFPEVTSAISNIVEMFRNLIT